MMYNLFIKRLVLNVLKILCSKGTNPSSLGIYEIFIRDVQFDICNFSL